MKMSSIEQVIFQLLIPHYWQCLKCPLLTGDPGDHFLLFVYYTQKVIWCCNTNSNINEHPYCHHFNGNRGIKELFLKKRVQRMLLCFSELTDD